MLGTAPLTTKSDETEKCDILLYLIRSDSEEAFFEEEKDSLLKQKLEIVQKYKVREDLYFEGTFWLAKESHVQKNEWIAAIFPNVSMPWTVEE